MKVILDGRVFTKGRIVHYVDIHKNEFPFLITSCSVTKLGHMASEWVFAGSHMFYASDVLYNPTRGTETFHFPGIQHNKKKPQAGKPLYDLSKKRV